MQTITLDGIEYVLVPKETLQPTIAGGVGSQPPVATQDAPRSPLEDFIGESVAPTTQPHVDDGLATQDEKEIAIRVVTPEQTVDVPKAQPKVYDYREKFLKKELMPSDVYATPKYDAKTLAGNPEDPMIKADAQKPASMRLFYGPGAQYEGY
jgi:hypothetical protein